MIKSHGSLEAIINGAAITFEEARQLISERVFDLVTWADKQFPWFNKLSETRQAVLIDLAYNMGTGRPGKSGLLGFPHFLHACSIPDWQQACEELERSRWDKQVPHRAKNDIELLKNG